MKHEGQSVPIVWENAQKNWTPYRIGQRPDGRVRVTPYFSAAVEDFSQESFSVWLPYEQRNMDVKKVEEGHYAVGGRGTLDMSDSVCTFTSNDGKNVYTAKIPSGEDRNRIATAMAIFGACMATGGK